MAKPIAAIGQMRHRARFERWIEVPDDLDNIKREYRLLDEVWGALTPVKPNRNLSGAQVVETGSHTLVIWYQLDLIVQEDHMRVVIDGKAYRILNHLETNETRRRIEITLDVTHENAKQWPAYDNEN
jgi:head-tail adaptor